MRPFARIVTPRLVLIPPDEADPVAVAAGIGNYDVTRWLALVPYPYSPDDARAFIAASRDHVGRRWFIRDGAGLVGGISIDPELGYWFARTAWGQGYATEAGDAVVDVHFADPEAGDLTSGYFLGNDRSGGVLRKLGFREAGQREIRARALAQMVPRQDMVLTRAAWRARREIRIISARLILRPMSERDVPALRRIAGDPDVARMLRRVPVPLPEEAVRDWLVQRRFLGRPGFLLVVDLPDAGPIGVVSLRADATIGFFLDRRYWGRGLATEAVAALLSDAAQRFPELGPITADHFADNPASGRVLEKLGFERTGTGRAKSLARKVDAEIVLYRRSRPVPVTIP